jgi:hypothetical protein
VGVWGQKNIPTASGGIVKRLQYLQKAFCAVHLLPFAGNVVLLSMFGLFAT